MSATGLKVFDTTLQKTNRWLNELMQLLGWGDRERAYLALRATLHALRDRLTVEEAAQLSAQLPMLVRGFYFEGWDPTGKPKKERHEEEFLMDIAFAFPDEQVVDPAQVTRAVFALLAIHVSEGELEDVRQLLPSGLRHLWPAHAQGGS
jgi:uncharacterized protein (DUF2267 family)